MGEKNKEKKEDETQKRETPQGRDPLDLKQTLLRRRPLVLGGGSAGTRPKRLNKTRGGREGIGAAKKDLETGSMERGLSPSPNRGGNVVEGGRNTHSLSSLKRKESHKFTCLTS